MRAATAAGALACLLAVLSGCGSSHGGSSASTGASGGGGSEHASTTNGSGAGEHSTPAGGIQVTTTPKFIAPPAGSPVRSGVVQIAMRDIALFPDAIRVKAGSKVRWTNYDNVLHNVTSVGGPQRLHSGNFGQGASFEVQLTKPGVIHYLSTQYPATMNGTIEVVG